MASKRKQSAECSSKARFGRRFVVYALAFGGLICLVWFRGLHSFAEWRAFACERDQQLLAAADWHHCAQQLGADSANYWLNRSRVARKLALDDERTQYLKRFRAKGGAVKVIELELLLAEAQRGRLSTLRNQLSERLLEGGRNDEICNAFVEGCLISYQLDDAISLLESWQADYPLDPRPHFLRGRILDHRSNVPGAIEQFQEALKKQPKYAAAAYNLAQTLLIEQKPADAIPHFQACAKYLGSPVPGWIGQARCCRLLRRYDEAKALIATAEQADVDRAGQAFRLVGESKESGQSELLAEKGRLAAEMNDHALAVACLEKALEKSPLDWRIRYQLALSQRQVGQMDLARQNIQRVEETKQAMGSCDRLFDLLQKDPGNIDARLHIGKVFLKYLSENQGLVWLNSVLELDENQGEAHRLLADYFEAHAGEHPEYAELARKHRSRATPAPDTAQ